LLTAAIETLTQLKDTNKINDGYGLIGATGLVYMGIAVSQGWISVSEQRSNNK
jgi:ATP-binding cassette subfamily C (CFTR/MRP) protein 1